MLFMLFASFSHPIDMNVEFHMSMVSLTMDQCIEYNNHDAVSRDIEKNIRKFNYKLKGIK